MPGKQTVTLINLRNNEGKIKILKQTKFINVVFAQSYAYCFLKCLKNL